MTSEGRIKSIVKREEREKILRSDEKLLNHAAAVWLVARERHAVLFEIQLLKTVRKMKVNRREIERKNCSSQSFGVISISRAINCTLVSMWWECYLLEGDDRESDTLQNVTEKVTLIYFLSTRGEAQQEQGDNQLRLNASHCHRSEVQGLQEVKKKEIKEKRVELLFTHARPKLNGDDRVRPLIRCTEYFSTFHWYTFTFTG